MRIISVASLILLISGCGSSAETKAEDTIGELNGWKVYRVYDRVNNVVCYSFTQREHLTCVYIPKPEEKHHAN